MYYILVDKITYVKSFDYTDNKVRFAGDKKYAKKFDMIELKTNFIQIRDSLLERGIKNVCILSECENDELGEVGLNKEFKTYKFYLEYKNGTSSNEKTNTKKKEKREKKMIAQRTNLMVQIFLILMKINLRKVLISIH